MKTLILYCYLETNETKQNLHFFIKNGIIQENTYKYIFLINNKICSLTFPDYENIELIHREENCGDLYTFNWFIEKMGIDYFIEYSNI